MLKALADIDSGEEEQIRLQNKAENETSSSTENESSKIQMREGSEKKMAKEPCDWSASLTKIQLRWGGTVTLEVII
mgnify:CR=1 FL=1